MKSALPRVKPGPTLVDMVTTGFGSFAYQQGLGLVRGYALPYLVLLSTILGVAKYLRLREFRIVEVWQRVVMSEQNFSFDWIWNLLKDVRKSGFSSLGWLRNTAGSNNSLEDVSKLIGNRVPINQ